MKTAIVTLTWNKLKEATIPFLDSLYAYTDPEDFELIIVDNGSHDGTVDYLSSQVRKRSNMKVLFNKTNLGYSKGNNQGLRMISIDAEIIGLLNNDILFTPGWLTRMRDFLLSEPRVGLASPRINLSSRINSANYLRRYRGLLGRYNSSFSLSITPFFCCVMLRRSTFEAIGFLDEDFSPAFFEDDDYSFRSLYAGFINGYVNTTFLFHNHCTTSGSLPNRKALIAKNQSLFFKKHYLGKCIYEERAWRKRPLLTLLRRMKTWLFPM